MLVPEPSEFLCEDPTSNCPSTKLNFLVKREIRTAESPLQTPMKLCEKKQIATAVIAFENYCFGIQE